MMTDGGIERLEELLKVLRNELKNRREFIKELGLEKSYEAYVDSRMRILPEYAKDTREEVRQEGRPEDELEVNRDGDDKINDDRRNEPQMKKAR